jgi:hypothetical protein
VPVLAEQSHLPNGIALNHPGIKWDWTIKAKNYTFIVTTISNYDMKNVNFDNSHKELIFTGNSTHIENIAEIEIPRNLIGGNLTVIQDGKQIYPLIILGTDSSTIVLKFNQTGSITTNIVGTTYLPEFSGIYSLVMIVSMGSVIVTLKIRKF